MRPDCRVHQHDSYLLPVRLRVGDERPQYMFYGGHTGPKLRAGDFNRVRQVTHQTHSTNVMILRVVELKLNLKHSETVSLTDSESLCPCCKFSFKSFS